MNIEDRKDFIDDLYKKKMISLTQKYQIEESLEEDLRKERTLVHPLTPFQSKELLNFLSVAAFPIRAGDVIGWSSVKRIIERNTASSEEVYFNSQSTECPRCNYRIDFVSPFSGEDRYLVEFSEEHSGSIRENLLFDEAIRFVVKRFVNSPNGKAVIERMKK